MVAEKVIDTSMAGFRTQAVDPLNTATLPRSGAAADDLLGGHAIGVFPSELARVPIVPKSEVG